MTTPETLYAGLSEASISDGFLNRFVFIAGSAPTFIRPPKLFRDNKVPATLVDALKNAQGVCPKGNPLLIGGKYSVPFEGGEGGSAHMRWNEIYRWQHDPAWNPVQTGLNGRAAENTIRFATIRAVGRDPANPTVNIHDVEWGWAIVHDSIAVVTFGTERHLAASPAEALRKAIVAALQDAKDCVLPFSKLLERRGVRGAAHYELEDALRWLMAAEVISDISGRKQPGKGSKFRLASVLAG